MAVLGNLTFLPRGRLFLSGWPFKLHSKIPICSSIFCENCSTTDYMLTTEKDWTWAWKSLSRLETVGKKKIASFSPQISKTCRIYYFDLVFRSWPNLFCDVICQVSVPQMSFWRVMLNVLSENALQTTLTVNSKFIPSSALYYYSNRFNQCLMFNSFQIRNVFFAKFQNKISNFLSRAH